MNYEEIKQTVETFIWAILGLIGIKFLRKSVDDNKDGRLSFKTEIIPFWGMMLLTYMVIRQGQYETSLYSDMVWTMICLLIITEAVIRFSSVGGLKNIISKKKDTFDKDIMEP